MVFRIFFVLTTYYNLNINQMDMKTTFFYGIIDQLVYI